MEYAGAIATTTNNLKDIKSISIPSIHFICVAFDNFNKLMT